MTVLDLEHVRAQFPAFAEPSLEGWAFFENAGGSYPCRQVIDRLTDYYRLPRVQPHHPYPLSERAGAMMDEGPARLAAMLGVGPDELFVGPSSTQNTSVLAHALGETLGPGAVLIVTEQDHEANRGAWLRMAAERGLTVRTWPVDPVTGVLQIDDLAGLLDGKVALVAFPHASNLVGQVNDVAAISRLVHDAGALAVLDAVAHAPHAIPDIDQLGVDVHLFSTYKTYGPHQGAMVVRRELAEQLPNQGHFFNAGIAGKRLVPAGPDHAQLAAIAGMVDYVEDLDRHHHPDESADDPKASAARVSVLWRDHETALLAPLLAHLEARDDVRLLGDASAEGRVPTVSIIASRPGRELAGLLAGHGIMCGGGHFYAHRLTEALGIDPDHGVLRTSFVHYTSPGDIDQLLSALDAVLS